MTAHGSIYADLTNAISIDVYFSPLDTSTRDRYVRIAILQLVRPVLL